jgi:pimeloyl-ACP methyl ester carboxylesterase
MSSARLVSLGDHAINVLSSGEGERHFTCLHGLVDNLDIWRRIAPALEARGRVTCIDQRGHGSSGSPPGPYSRAQLARDVAGVLDAEHVERTILVGHSMGGIVAMETALTLPERVAGLVLIGTTSECREKVAAWYERIALAGEQDGTAGLGRAIYGEKSTKQIIGDAQGISHVTRMLKSLHSDPLTRLRRHAHRTRRAAASARQGTLAAARGRRARRHRPRSLVEDVRDLAPNPRSQPGDTTHDRVQSRHPSPGGELDHRLRELLIMRIGWTTGSDYEWTQHWKIAREQFGCSDQDLLELRDDWRASAHFGDEEKTLLAAVDALLEQGSLSEELTTECLERFGRNATIELTTAVGCWRLVSMVARTLQIPLETGIASWPPDGRRPGDDAGS